MTNITKRKEASFKLMNNLEKMAFIIWYIAIIGTAIISIYFFPNSLIALIPTILVWGLGRIYLGYMLYKNSNKGP